MKSLLCIITLAAAASFFSPVSALEPGFKEYYNPKLHFRFTYPENWTVEDAKRGDAYVRLFAPQQGASTFRNMIEITRQAVAAGTAFPAWAEAQTGPLKKAYPSLTSTGGGPVVIHGKNAYLSSYVIELEGVKGTLTRVYSLQGDLLITCTLVAEAGKLETLMPVLQNAMNSVKPD